MLKMNKGTLIEHVRGKDIFTQGDKPRTGCLGSMSLDKEEFLVKAHS